jgi:hypothetical protein
VHMLVNYNCNQSHLMKRKTKDFVVKMMHEQEDKTTSSS